MNVAVVQFHSVDKLAGPTASTKQVRQLHDHGPFIIIHNSPNSRSVAESWPKYDDVGWRARQHKILAYVCPADARVYLCSRKKLPLSRALRKFMLISRENPKCLVLPFFFRIHTNFYRVLILIYVTNTN